jgi:hypothetical protein
LATDFVDFHGSEKQETAGGFVESLAAVLAMHPAGFYGTRAEHRPGWVTDFNGPEKRNTD